MKNHQLSLPKDVFKTLENILSGYRSIPLSGLLISHILFELSWMHPEIEDEHLNYARIYRCKSLNSII